MIYRFSKLAQASLASDSDERSDLLKRIIDNFDRTILGNGKDPLRVICRSMLWDDDDLVVSNAIDLLALCGDENDAPCIRPFLKDKRWVVRMSAYDAIGDLMGSKASKRLRSGFRDPVEYVRKHAYAAYATTVAPAVYERQFPSLWAAEGDDFARTGLINGLFLTDLPVDQSLVESLLGSPFPRTVSTMKGLLENEASIRSSRNTSSIFNYSKE